MGRLVVLFDEGCLLCSHTVKFLHAQDREGVLWFAGLGSEFAAERREAMQLPEAGASAESFAVVDEVAGQVFFESDGVVRVLRELGSAWRVCSAVLGVMPKSLRDLGYRIVAKNRRRWFGEAENCELPPGSLRERVLS